MRSGQFRPFSILLALGLVLSLVGSAGAGPSSAGQMTLGDSSLIRRADTQDSTLPKENKLRSSLRPAAQGKPVSVLVKLGFAPLVSYHGGVAGLPGTSPRATGKKLDIGSADSRRYLAHIDRKQRDFEARAKGKIPQAQVSHRFDLVFGGAALTVPGDRVRELASLPEVQAVYTDALQQLDTERSPAFIGAPTLWNQLGGQDDAGEGVIVGVLDTGIWPEHPAYADPDPLGKPYAGPPPPLSGTRACEFSGGANPGAPFACNNKLIGADRFMATYDAVIGLLPAEFTTARDDNGHGTHTSSTAAGNRGVAASIFGISRGTISGIAPRAHVIMYKVCGDQGCFQSDSVAAVQEAIRDGVNVVNFSISGGANPFSDAVELAFLDAYGAGVFVAASAGNSGPTPDTVDHRGPWVTTVGASTSDRHFLSTVTLVAGNGDPLALTGATVTTGITTPTPVVNAASAPYNDPLCLNTTPDGAFTGKIVVCQRGVVARIQKSFNVAQRGAVGLLLYNPTPQGLNTDNHFVPSLHLENTDGAQLVAFLANHTGVTATFPAGVASEVPGDVMAPFSSRGGPGQTLGINKPDVTAPGVQILAGHTPAPATPEGGPPGQLFQSIQGTSMSSPHTAGAAALLKDRHPDWTPGQIKSALMTTATQQVVKEDGTTPFTAFDAGSGRIDLTRAGDPGLTFDVSSADYVTFSSQLYRVNYPSLYIPSMPGKVSVQRRARGVGPTATWSLEVKLVDQSPKDFKVSVPGAITVPAGGETPFDITIDASNVPLGATRFATLKLTNGARELRLPITFVRGRAAVELANTCDPASFPQGSTTTCTLKVTNTTFDAAAAVDLIDRLPSKLRLVSGSATGGATESDNTIAFSGVVPASQPPNVAIGAGSSPGGGYLPLRLFGVAPIGGVGDETIVNFSVPAYQYGGETYTRIGIVSNGYGVVGGGTGADVDFINQVLPNPVRPNNVLAPFWTDLNPAAGGALRIATLTDGADTWLVLDWEGVREFSLPRLNSFQIWIGINGDAHPGEDISFAFGTLQGNGDVGFLTVGAENRFGNRGQNHYVNGVGTLPVNGTQLRVTTTPGATSTKVITFQAEGQAVGQWTNYAEMTGDLFYGTTVAAFSGEVTKKP